jgi:hypothetical protein
VRYIVGTEREKKIRKQSEGDKIKMKKRRRRRKEGC